MKTICKQNKYISLVERIYNEDVKPQRYNGSIASMLREFFSKTSKVRCTWKRETFKALLIHLYNQKCYALLRSYQHVEVLLNISVFGNRIVRDIETWENQYVKADEQISSLLKHCFAKYDTPVFLEQSFYQSQKLYMLWYIQLGSGKSVKELSQLPVVLTNRMAHEFRAAPSFLSANEALRYAQAIGFGATKQMAKIIAFSRLSIIREEQEPFWATVVRFFAKVETLELNELNQMVDYLAYKYREDRSFTMKGRTFNALLNQTNEWHRRAHLKKVGRVLSWPSSKIKPLYREETIDGKTVVYKTIELRNSVELYDEGQAMNHCVAEYDEDCIDGVCSIFSLQREVSGQEPERLATIEIELPSLEIVQAKAKYNEDPGEKSLELINQWINNSTVKRQSRMGYERPYEQVVQNRPPQRGAYERAIEREQMRNNEDISIACLIKIIFWLLYFIFRLILMN